MLPPVERVRSARGATAASHAMRGYDLAYASIQRKSILRWTKVGVGTLPVVSGRRRPMKPMTRPHGMRMANQIRSFCSTFEA